ncbi:MULTISPECIES: hypothetical protein [unclassified Burkholderia]|uniref:hypothetical protein n=1 Tax=unclassified Burkholderia TaxID=2613784 RepID=UPI000A8A254D|nr:MULTISPECIES: hypothetical protein [unclassified Burkholderia]
MADIVAPPRARTDLRPISALLARRFLYILYNVRLGTARRPRTPIAHVAFLSRIRR